MRSPGRAWLLWGALLSFAIALFHIIIAFVDIPLVPHFGALLRRDAFILSLFGALYFLFGIYALSGGGWVRRLPLLDVGLVVMSSIYTLRGLGVFTETFQLLAAGGPFPLHLPLISLMFLVTGCVYLVGTIKSWEWLHGEGEAQKDKGSRLEI
jgi:hypothetical protein